MTQQPSSSSSFAHTNDGDNNVPPQEPRIDSNYLITKLCNILDIDIGQQEDITSQSFGENLLEYLQEEIERSKDARSRMEGVINAHAQRRQFQGGARVNQFQPEYANIKHEREADVSQMNINTIPVLSPSMSIVNVPEVNSISSTPPYSASPGPTSPSFVITSSYHVPTPVQTTEDTQNGNSDHYGNMAPHLSRTLQSTSHPLEDLRQPRSTNETDVAMEDNFVDELINGKGSKSNDISKTKVGPRRSRRLNHTKPEHNVNEKRQKPERPQRSKNVSTRRPVKTSKPTRPRELSPQNPMLMSPQDINIDLEQIVEEDKTSNLADRDGIAIGNERRNGSSMQQASTSQISTKVEHQHHLKPRQMQGYFCEICKMGYIFYNSFIEHLVEDHHVDEKIALKLGCGFNTDMEEYASTSQMSTRVDHQHPLKCRRIKGYDCKICKICFIFYNSFIGHLVADHHVARKIALKLGSAFNTDTEEYAAILKTT